MPRPPFDGKLFITQRFGARPEYYSKYGHLGHNGLDLIALYPNNSKVSHPVLWSMLPGVWHLRSERTWYGKWIGYGASYILHFGLGSNRVEEWLFGHLQNRRFEHDGKNIGENIRMGEMDNTGDSTGEHCHITRKILVNGRVENYNNGYHGATDPLPRLKELGFNFTNG